MRTVSRAPALAMATLALLALVAGRYAYRELASPCEDAPGALVAAIDRGLHGDDGSRLRGTSAVLSSDGIWYVSASIGLPGLEEGRLPATWATDDLDGPGRIVPVDKRAREVSSYEGPGARAIAPNPNDPAARLSVDCVVSQGGFSSLPPPGGLLLVRAVRDKVATTGFL